MSLDDDEPVLAGMTSMATGMRRATYVLRARIMRAAAQNTGRHAVLCCAVLCCAANNILSTTTRGKQNESDSGLGGGRRKTRKKMANPEIIHQKGNTKLQVLRCIPIYVIWSEL